LHDYLKSKTNIKILETFASEKLSNDYLDSKKELQETIAFEIENYIDILFVPAWAVNAENISEMNSRIWKYIRPRIITSMDSRIPTKKDVIIAPRIFLKDSEAQEDVAERSNFHEEKYAQLWNRF